MRAVDGGIMAVMNVSLHLRARRTAVAVALVASAVASMAGAAGPPQYADATALYTLPASGIMQVPAYEGIGVEVLDRGAAAR
jgi:hypothetical protein